MDMTRFRQLHLGALVVVLVVVSTIVVLRGVDARGLSLIGMIAVIVAFRGWQLWRSQRPPTAD
jgi:hypothetical protein